MIYKIIFGLYGFKLKFPKVKVIKIQPINLKHKIFYLKNNTKIFFIYLKSKNF